MVELQQRGCHNINWVSPSHQLYGIVEALSRAATLGLSLPIVYNTHSYDSLEALHLLDGIIDIYLPDLKYADNEHAVRLGAPRDYVERAREAIQEMYRQVGGLVLNHEGLAQSGVLVRLLVLPNNVSGTVTSLEWLATAVGRGVGVNVMAQYHPAYKAYQIPQLCRRVSLEEYREAVTWALDLGFKYVYYDSVALRNC